MKPINNHREDPKGEIRTASDGRKFLYVFEDAPVVSATVQPVVTAAPLVEEKKPSKVKAKK